MNSRQRQWVDALTRRRSALNTRVQAAEEKGVDLSYDKREISALNFAIECIGLADGAGLLSAATGLPKR